MLFKTTCRRLFSRHFKDENLLSVASFFVSFSIWLSWQRQKGRMVVFMCSLCIRWPTANSECFRRGQHFGPLLSWHTHTHTYTHTHWQVTRNTNTQANSFWRARSAMQSVSLWASSTAGSRALVRKTTCCPSSPAQSLLFFRVQLFACGRVGDYSDNSIRNRRKTFGPNCPLSVLDLVINLLPEKFSLNKKKPSESEWVKRECEREGEEKREGEIYM